ncbi:MAG: LLM class F420-dependent oxidoreductase [Actinomycetota bacterium]
MRFLFQYPDAHGLDGHMLAAGAVGEVACAVELAGFDGIAFTEHPAPSARWLEAGGHQTLDPFVALSHAAAVTERIRLFTYLSVGPYRNPFMLGKTAASVDVLSNGRLELGLGTGYQKAEFKALGVDFESRNAEFDEMLDVLPRFWSGNPVATSGRAFEARDTVCRPRPHQQPIPIWIGGNSNLTMRRVAERAQGWMPMLTDATVSATTRTAHIGDASTLAHRITELKDLAAGRPIGILVSYLDQSLWQIGFDVERHRDAIGELARAGATWVSLSAPSESFARTTELLGYYAETFKN